MLIAFMTFGCSDNGPNDDANDAIEDELIFQNITYTGQIEALVKTNCIACHTNPPNNGASIPLTTYDAVKNAVETRDLISKINSVTNPMPPGGLMSKDTRRIFDAWIAQGLKEN